MRLAGLGRATRSASLATDPAHARRGHLEEAVRALPAWGTLGRARYPTSLRPELSRQHRLSTIRRQLRAEVSVAREAFRGGMQIEVLGDDTLSLEH